MDRLYLKHRVVRTPLEQPVQGVRRAFGLHRVARHPGLFQVWREDTYIGRALRSILTPSSNTIDVGAHLGSTLSRICSLSPLGHHVAYEAVARKASWVQDKFPEVDVRTSAVSDAVGEIRFNENLSRPGFSSISGDDEPGWSRGDSLRELTVPCTTLDADIDAERPLDYIKIDVEGAELSVLRGGAELICRHRPVLLFESGPEGYERFGHAPLDLYDFIVDELGYSVHLPKRVGTSSDGLTSAQFEQANVYPFAAFNYFALPDASGRGQSVGRSRSSAA